MVLEATMILIDNSEYMRNGDYQPTRLRSQEDAVNVVFTNKSNANPESTIGLMTMAGKSPEVLVSPTIDTGKILTALHKVKINGEVDIQTSIQVAQLALKHRQNKNQRQRIVVFLGSPAGADEKALVRLAKKLKKSNIAVDIISFGEEELNEPILRSFIEVVQSGDNSHLLSVPASPHMLLSDMVLSSPILAGEDITAGMDVAGGSGSGGGGGGGQDFEFGVDPSLDPELAMALRMSLEEERARQAQSGSTPAAPAASAAASATLPNVPEVPTATMIPVDVDDDEEAMLQQALLLSQAEAESGAAADDGDVEMGGDDDDEEDEDEAIARAIEMSMKSAEEESGDHKPKPKPK